MADDKLSVAQQRWVTQMYACYEPTEAIIERLKENGVVIRRKAHLADTYDFSRRTSGTITPTQVKLIKELELLFWKTRKEYDEAMSNHESRVPIMQAAYRQNLLQHVAEKYSSNPQIALKVIEAGEKLSNGGYNQQPGVTINNNVSATATATVEFKGFTMGMIADALQMSLEELGLDGEDQL